MAPLRQAQSTPVSAPAGRAAVAVPEAENQAAAAPVAPALISAAIDERFEALLKRVRANRPNEDTSLIRKAWEFCVGHHAGQLRASGEPYIIHPLEVAEVLAEMKMDATAIAAGLLHDAVEDTPATSAEIDAEFGDQE